MLQYCLPVPPMKIKDEISCVDWFASQQSPSRIVKIIASLALNVLSNYIVRGSKYYTTNIDFYLFWKIQKYNVIRYGSKFIKNWIKNIFPTFLSILWQSRILKRKLYFNYNNFVKRSLILISLIKNYLLYIYN